MSVCVYVCVCATLHTFSCIRLNVSRSLSRTHFVHASIDISATSLRAILAFDVDSSGWNDIVIAMDSGVRVLVNRGRVQPAAMLTARFDAAVLGSRSGALSLSEYRVMLTDLDGDNLPEAVLMGQAPIACFFPNRNGTFFNADRVLPSSMSPLVNPTSVANGLQWGQLDGVPGNDFAMRGSLSIRIRFNNGQGLSFSGMIEILLLTAPSSIALMEVADMTGDGSLPLLVAGARSRFAQAPDLFVCTHACGNTRRCVRNFCHDEQSRGNLNLCQRG